MCDKALSFQPQMCECGICIILLAGTVSEFKKKFETPILRGRDADASDADHKKGAEKLAEVALLHRGWKF